MDGDGDGDSEQPWAIDLTDTPPHEAVDPVAPMEPEEHGYDSDEGIRQEKIQNLKDEAEAAQAELLSLRDDIARLQRKAAERESHIRACRAEIASLKKRRGRKKPSHSSSGSFDPAGRFEWDGEVMRVLKGTFRIARFRPNQREALNTTISGRDCFVIMPTGGGKSLIYQLAAIIRRGFSVVVSPLLSLIQDQVSQLRDLGIPAEQLNSTNSKEDKKRIFGLLKDGGGDGRMKLVYVTPELVSSSKRFMSYLEKAYNNNRLDRIVIDEAHCCSQWGHDFRPDYKKLGLLRQQMPDVPILALTATATDEVFKDVKKILRMPRARLFKNKFNRPNLFYRVLPKPDSASDCSAAICKWIQDNHGGETGIVYCYSTKECDTLANFLRSNGISSLPYHAQMYQGEREAAYNNWWHGEVQVVCATIAFGLGINKLDVRFVIHQTISKAMESYYQESGRAGRDGKRADCVLLYSPKDLAKQSPRVFHLQTGLDKLYAMIDYATSTRSCRRTTIARYFGEAFPSSACMRFCDICARDGSSNHPPFDAREVAEGLLGIAMAEQGGGLAGRTAKGRGKTKKKKKKKISGLTSNQLIDEWWRSTKKTQRVVKKDDVMHIVVKMIMDGILKEQFRHTVYSAISYVTPGSRRVPCRSYPVHLPSTAAEKLRPRNSTKKSKPKSRSSRSTTPATARKRSRIVQSESEDEIEDPPSSVQKRSKRLFSKGNKEPVEARAEEFDHKSSQSGVTAVAATARDNSTAAFEPLPSSSDDDSVGQMKSLGRFFSGKVPSEASRTTASEAPEGKKKSKREKKEQARGLSEEESTAFDPVTGQVYPDTAISTSQISSKGIHNDEAEHGGNSEEQKASSSSEDDIPNFQINT